MDIEKITLPSGIKCEIQELTAEAEKILSNKQDMKSGKWIDKFMMNAVISIDGKTFDNNKGELMTALLDMKTGDRNFLLLKIRMLTYGSDMVFNYQCPKCGNNAGYKFDLQELLDDGTLKVYPFSQDVPVAVETRQGIAEINYMTGREEQWLASQKDLDTIKLAMATCKSFNGEAPNYKDFEKLSARDLMKIRMAYSNLKGGLDPRIELDCLECDNSFTIMLYQIPDFFTPLTTLESIGL